MAVFKSDPDAYLIEHYELPPKAISCGSDLRAASPRELLGIFVGFRGRHMRDAGRWDEAERDYLLARHLFPSNRKLYIDAMGVAIDRSVRLFEPGELGSPQSLADWVGHAISNCPSVGEDTGEGFPVPERVLHSIGMIFRGAAAMTSTRTMGQDGVTLRILGGTDPLGFAAGDANLYRYVGNDPVDKSDPSGLFEQPSPGYTYPDYKLIPIPPTPDQQRLQNLVSGNPQLEKELELILKQIAETHVVPNTPVLSYFIPEVFGSHCMRYGEKLYNKLSKLQNEKQITAIQIKLLILRYPATGGPNHLILLLNINGTMVGIDNGAIGGDDGIFDPSNHSRFCWRTPSRRNNL